MSDLRDAVQMGHATLKRKLGRDPTIAELFTEVGEDAGKSSQNVRQAAKRIGLALAPSRGGGRSAIAKTKTPHKTPKGRRKKSAELATANGHATTAADEGAPHSIGSSIAIMALQAERTRVAAELAAIDGVIERLRGKRDGGA